jgi:dipeptidyl aminopeptidase/acylaminoacyl peptidase
LTQGERTLRGVDHVNGVLAFSFTTVDRPAEIAVLTGGSERRLTNLSAAYVATVHPRPWQHFLVPTTDGVGEIDAWIMRPAEDAHGDGGKLPVILNVHGGPHAQYGEGFFDEAQFQAAAGFVVVMCNPRGSSGREESWGQAIVGRLHPAAAGAGWGSVDVDDVMAVLDAALERFEFCDPDRVGMQGGSYGGYMATMLASRHGKRFRGICSERAVNNMISEEWSSDIATVFRTQHGPNHLEAEEEYARMSPVRAAADIDVPMLIIHSENDLRCPIAQAEELFVALRLLGKDVTFYRFPGETHELSRSGSPVHRRQRAEIILDWFAERLAPR